MYIRMWHIYERSTLLCPFAKQSVYGILTLVIVVALPQNGSLVALKKDAKIAAFGVLKYVYTSCRLTSLFRHTLHLF